ncbi:MAG TPA: hypothetical protein VHY35_08925 [Stellaceae bacterium]|jgi:hypothetical protein|nr:hypothetical protein [Stellaceae bacterium]
MNDTLFSDKQVTSACNLHVDNLRRLITWGAVTPAQAGGGRGRVRQWTARQALRVSVTAQFVEVGFSLQMAHTLTYCLPLDDLLYAYDPVIIRTVLKSDRDEGALRLKAMISRRGKYYWPGKRYMGSEVIIVDRQFVYADVLGDCPTLLAVIDLERQRVYPSFSPLQFVFGAGMAEDHNLPKIIDAQKISRNSLLIDDEHLTEDRPHRPLPIIPQDLDSQLLSLDTLVCRNFIAINLAVGLTACVRKLLNLPLHYIPMQEGYDEN